MQSDEAAKPWRSPRSVSHISELSPGRRHRDAEAGAIAKPLPLYRRRSRACILARDRRLISDLSASLSLDCNLTVLPTIEACLSFLDGELGQWEKHYAQLQQLLDRWLAGEGELVRLVLKHLCRAPGPRLTSVLVADYHLVGFHGLQQLSERMNWQGAHLLLTGVSNALALATFTDGYIDQVWANDAPPGPPEVPSVVRELMLCPDRKAQQIFSSTLCALHARLLNERATANDLLRFAEHQWQEWICIGEPFGILGIDHRGNVSWLQLQATEQIDSVLRTAQAYNLSPEQLAAVRNGELICTCELHRSLALPSDEPQVSEAFGIGEGEGLRGALVNLAPQMLLRK